MSVSYLAYLQWALKHVDFLPTLFGLVQGIQQAATWEERWEVLKSIGDSIMPILDDFPDIDAGQVTTAAQDLDIADLETAIVAELQLQGQYTAQALNGAALQALFAAIQTLLPLLLSLKKGS